MAIPFSLNFEASRLNADLTNAYMESSKSNTLAGFCETILTNYKNTISMENNQTYFIIHQVFNALEKLIPQYMEIVEDKSISNGNVAVCIIDDQGFIHGRMYGTNKPRLRQSYRVAWTKASQVWLTGIKTGEYERMVFNKEVGENANGIEAPDLIGWEGGQPLTLKNGAVLSVGFSGFRGITDLEIMSKALAAAEQIGE